MIRSQELLKIGVLSADPKQTNKFRWREASHCWNENGFLYETYYHLTEKKNPQSNGFIWKDDLLWNFARDHKVELFVARQAMSGLLDAKGELRKRAPRRIVATGHHSHVVCRDSSMDDVARPHWNPSLYSIGWSYPDK